jgi:hypothetical protein
MTVPTLEFYSADWHQIPANAGIELMLSASPPVAATVGIMAYARPASTAQPWTKIGKTTIDNLAFTGPIQRFSMVVKHQIDYVLRFQGEAHLLMPGFSDIKIGFILQSQAGPITNFGGTQTASNTRAAAINGMAFLHCS